jgi:hypothetical protein
VEFARWLELMRTAFIVLAAIVALESGWVAVSDGTRSSWPDKSSPLFALEPNSEGTWAARWEPTGRRGRERCLAVRYEEDSESRESLELDVRVDPEVALADESRRCADAEGWIGNALAGGCVLVSAKPALVQRIPWRVRGTRTSPRAPRCRFFVPGIPDPKHPENWPCFTVMSGLPAAFALAMEFLPRGPRSRAPEPIL